MYTLIQQQQICFCTFNNFISLQLLIHLATMPIIYRINKTGQNRKEQTKIQGKKTEKLNMFLWPKKACY